MPRPELDGVRVLVIDDEPDSLDVMTMALRHFGALVTGVPSSKHAFEILDDVMPSVIVSDLAMPHHDGLSFIRRLRAAPSHRSTPVIAVTAYGGFYEVPELRSAGFTRVLPKPVDPADLAAAVAAAAHPPP